MKYLILPLALLAGPALADDAPYPQSHLDAIGCTENLGDSTTWGQCLNVIFADCAPKEVGNAEHMACLTDMRKSWSKTVEGLTTQVTANISSEGAVELASLRGQWTGYVVQKCQGVAESKPEGGKDAARVGCEIAEIVGLSGELAACLQGRSTAEYCRRP